MTLYSISPESLLLFNSNKTKTKEGLDLSDFVNSRKPARLADGIGHVHIYGPLLRDSAPIDRTLGATDYSEIITDLNSLVEQGARAIVLHIDSGGGMVNGCIEAAEAIQNCRIPIVVHADGLACSAAYKLAAGASWIVASRSAEVGNIGTILVSLDTSAALSNLGVSFDCFTNEGATLKSTGHLASLTDEQKGFLQDSINAAGAAFKAHVTANRPGIDEEVFRAGWYSGERALALGLIDEIGSEALAVQRATELADTFLTPNESL